MAALFPLTPRTDSARSRGTQLPAPWRRTDDGAGGKCSSRYAHPAGYTIAHCGHPTANWPYALYAPNGDMILAPNGRAWQKLVHIAIAVNNLLEAK